MLKLMLLAATLANGKPSPFVQAGSSSTAPMPSVIQICAYTTIKDDDATGEKTLTVTFAGGWAGINGDVPFDEVEFGYSSTAPEARQP